MTKRVVLPILALLIIMALGFAWYAGTRRHELAMNPDPNHTHADFAVWVDGQPLDFSSDFYMSGSSTDPSHDQEPGNRKYLHLHDGNGHVLHRHKPGLSLHDFFATLPNSFSYSGSQLIFADSPVSKEAYTVRLFVNGAENKSGGSYLFNDGDHLLITDAQTDAELQTELSAMTDDACKYSKTCPWKGPPPTENCIADPQVPCVVQ